MNIIDWNALDADAQARALTRPAQAVAAAMPTWAASTPVFHSGVTRATVSTTLAATVATATHIGVRVSWRAKNADSSTLLSMKAGMPKLIAVRLAPTMRVSWEVKRP